MENKEILALKKMVEAMEIELKAYRITARNVTANKLFIRRLYEEIFETKYIGFDCTSKPLIDVDL
jgi:hypothetical protein